MASNHEKFVKEQHRMAIFFECLMGALALAGTSLLADQIFFDGQYLSPASLDNASWLGAEKSVLTVGTPTMFAFTWLVDYFRKYWAKQI